MPNYTQPDYVTKRLRYYYGQFLEDQDFVDEQLYQLDRERRLARTLHAPGVAEGLVVTAGAPGSSIVQVGPGTALDAQGRLILVPNTMSFDLSGFKTRTTLLLIRYSEASSDSVTAQGVTGDTRWTESAALSAIIEGQPQDPNTVTLARVPVDANGNVTLDLSVRVYAGVRLPGGSALRANATGQATLPGDLLMQSPGNVIWGNRSRLTTDQGGSLDLGGDNSTAGTGQPYIDFHYTGKTEDYNVRIQNDADGRLSLRAGTVYSSGNLGVGTPTPAAQLHITGGRSDLAGTEGDLKIGDATYRLKVGVSLTGGGAGDVRVRAQGGTNRLILGSATNDILSLAANGVGIGVLDPLAKLHVSGGDVMWGTRSRLTTDQGGSIELGGDNSAPGTGSPYIDFHFNGKTEEFNARIQNDADGRLTIQALTVALTGKLAVGLGTTAPLTPLHIPAGGLQIGASATSTDNFHLVSDTLNGPRALRLYNGNYGNGTHLLSLTGAGNVGIGTPNPDGKVVVVDQGTTGYAVQVRSNPTTDIWRTQLLLLGSVLNTDARIGFATTRPDGTGAHTAIIKTVVPTDGGGDLVFQTREPGFINLPERLRITSRGDILWGNRSGLMADQGGSLELGGDSATPGTGSPYIDFHYNGRAQDFNVRLQNDADGQLSVRATAVYMTNNLTVGGFPLAGSGQGSVNVTGPTGELGMVRRTLSAMPASPVGGDRFVWYNGDGNLRLWTHANNDLMLLSPVGGLALDQGNRNSGSVQPGLSFGLSSGEGIASRRTPGDNQYGLDFYTNGQRRMYINIGGGIGTSGSLTVGGELVLGTNRTSINGFDGGGTNGYHWVRTNGDDNQMWFAFVNAANTNVQALNRRLELAVGLLASATTYKGSGSSSWSILSDVEAKHNIAPLQAALDRLVRLRGVTFEWKDPKKHSDLVGPQMGLIAQEVAEVFPEWVGPGPGGHLYLTMTGFEALAVEAFKELQAENQALRTRYRELEARVQVLEA